MLPPVTVVEAGSWLAPYSLRDKLLRFAPLACAAPALLETTDAFQHGLPDAPSLSRALHWAVRLLVVAGLCLRRDHLEAAVRRAAPAWALVAFAAASLFWSVDPALSVYACRFLADGALVGLLLGTFPARHQLRLALSCVLVPVAASETARLLRLPWVFDGALFIGVFVAKQTLGRAASLLAALCALEAACARGVWRAAAAGGFALGCAVVLQTRSLTSLAAVAAAVALVALFALASDWRLRRWLGAAVALCAAAAVVLVALTAFPRSSIARAAQRLSGRSSENLGDLSLRTLIWPMAIDAADLHPWLGAGLGAAYSPRTALAQASLEKLGMVPWYAHDEPLDALVDLGVVGVCLLAAAAASSAAAALARLRAQGDLAGRAWPAVFLAWLWTMSITEVGILKHPSASLAIFLGVAALGGLPGPRTPPAAQAPPPARPARRRLLFAVGFAAVSAALGWAALKARAPRYEATALVNLPVGALPGITSWHRSVGEMAALHVGQVLGPAAGRCAALLEREAGGAADPRAAFAERISFEPLPSSQVVRVQAHGATAAFAAGAANAVADQLAAMTAGRLPHEQVQLIEPAAEPASPAPRHAGFLLAVAALIGLGLGAFHGGPGRDQSRAAPGA